MPTFREFKGSDCARGGQSISDIENLSTDGPALPRPTCCGVRPVFQHRGNEMLFCITAQYTSQAISAMLDDPSTNRAEAISKLIEAAGGKLVSLYFYPAEGPGVMVTFDVPEPNSAASIAAIAVAGGGVQNLKLTRLLTPDEVRAAQQRARQIRSAYKPPGK